MLFGNPPPVHLILLKESSLCHNFYILMDFCLFFYGFFLRIDGTTTEETLLPFCPTAPDTCRIFASAICDLSGDTEEWSSTFSHIDSCDWRASEKKLVCVCVCVCTEGRDKKGGGEIRWIMILAMGSTALAWGIRGEAHPRRNIAELPETTSGIHFLVIKIRN